jgi:molybdenum cofactor cytidylyltransferase
MTLTPGARSPGRSCKAGPRVANLSPGFPTLAAVLLAAGSSLRYGTDNKLLAKIDDTPLIARVATALVSAQFGDIVVVTGHEAPLLERALKPVSSTLRFVHNPQHHDGMGGSIATGVAALAPHIKGVLIAQGDMPDVDAALIGALCQRFIKCGSDRIVVPWLGEGRQGNPVLWPRRLFADLAGLRGEQGAKPLIKAAGDAIERVMISDTSAATDIDTPEQLATYTRAQKP